jgi:hypothetical protein
MNNLPSASNQKTEIVSISEEKDLIYWTIKPGITTEVLKSAIRATRCVTLNDIFVYLDKKTSSTLRECIRVILIYRKLK